MKTCLSLIIAGLLLAFATGCTSTAKRTQQTENVLLASGFNIVTATNSAQQAHLQTLPPGQIKAVKRNGKIWYVFPDAARHQLYVGNLFQYQTFQGYVQDATLLHAQAETANLTEDSAGWNSWAYWDFAN